MVTRKANRPNAGPGDDVGAAELGRRVAENLRQRRKARGMSLDDLARVVGRQPRGAVADRDVQEQPHGRGPLEDRGRPRRAHRGAHRRAPVGRRRCSGGGTAQLLRSRTASSRVARSRPRERRPSWSSTSCAYRLAPRTSRRRTRRGPTRCSSSSAACCRMHVDEETHELGAGDADRVPRRPSALLREPRGQRGALPQRHRVRAVTARRLTVRRAVRYNDRVFASRRTGWRARRRPKRPRRWSRRPRARARPSRSRTFRCAIARVARASWRSCAARRCASRRASSCACSGRRAAASRRS